MAPKGGEIMGKKRKLDSLPYPAVPIIISPSALKCNFNL